MKIYMIISFISLILIFSGCGGKGSKERCEEKEGNWEWNKIENKCEPKPPSKTRKECEARGGMWNVSTSLCEGEMKETQAQQDCKARGGVWNAPTSQCEGVSELTQEECETEEKKKEGFGWVNSQCEEKAMYIIYNYLEYDAIKVSSGEMSVWLQQGVTDPDCVRIKRSQWSSLKIRMGTQFITVCNNADDTGASGNPGTLDNNCKISPSIYDEEEGTHKYRVQWWRTFYSKSPTLEFLAGGHTDKDLSHCKELASGS